MDSLKIEQFLKQISILMHLRSIGLLMVLTLVSCNRIDKLNETPITIEAHFMRYACGDWNDDMKVLSVSDGNYDALLGTDVDPEFLNGEDEIRGWLFDNETEAYGFNYRLTGFVSACAQWGCSKGTPKFWMTKITKLNGDVFDTSGDH